MTQPTNNVYNQPETESASSFKDQEKYSMEGVRT